jgi:aldehyde dehydrogenase (NAD+)
MFRCTMVMSGRVRDREQPCRHEHPLQGFALVSAPLAPTPGSYCAGLPLPVGVVGQIVPWNFPLMFTGWKLGPALAAGNTVVLKPAELTPLTSLRLAELIAAGGFPPGVVNIVPGLGEVAGARRAAHRDVRKLSFTGSTEVGREIVRASAGNLKRLQLELGGKGANIVFADADLDAAVNGSAFAIFHNQGQACIAGSRLLLEEPIAVEEGGEVLLGGRAPADPVLARGCYVEPTVVRAGPADRVNREEVFGPFVSVLTFRGERQALELANSVDYGLGGGLWTRDLQRGHRMAAAIRSGMVWVNSYKRVSPGSPFGGVGDSGYGREMGFEAMHGYTEPKSVWVNVDAELPVWYPR